MGTGAVRIHFTSDDLARIQVTDAPDPKIELTLSLRALRGRSNARRLSSWRREVGGHLGPPVRPLLDFVPYPTVLPDFLDPHASEVDGGVHVPRMVTTPPHLVHGYLSVLAWRHDVPRTAGRFADGGADAMRELGAAVTAYYDTAIEPYWNDVRSIVDSDRSVRARTLLDGGVDRVFNTLHHTITWRPPVLRVAMNSGFDFDVHLKGQGIRLQASVFAGAQPVLWDYHFVDEPPTLVYPAYFDGRSPTPTSHPSLVSLIGRTRAQLLAAIADGPGTVTGNLARRLGISPASASEHATVLRNAGLITTIRYGKSALHTVTPLGAALLEPTTALTEGH